MLISSSIQIVSIELAQTNAREAMIYKYEAPTDKLIMNIEYQEQNKLICMYNNSIDVLNGQTSNTLVELENQKLSPHKMSQTLSCHALAWRSFITF